MGVLIANPIQGLPNYDSMQTPSSAYLQQVATTPIPTSQQNSDLQTMSPMNSTEETYEAIKTMLNKLDDPFTRFLEPEKYALLSESTMSANITGVGVEMAYADDGRIVVVAPTPGGPADEAGVKPNDMIIEVDGRPTDGLSLYEVADAKAAQTQLAQNHVWSRTFPYADNWLRLGLPAPDRWEQLESAF